MLICLGTGHGHLSSLNYVSVGHSSSSGGDRFISAVYGTTDHDTARLYRIVTGIARRYYPPLPVAYRASYNFGPPIELNGMSMCGRTFDRGWYRGHNITRLADSRTGARFVSWGDGSRSGLPRVFVLKDAPELVEWRGTWLPGSARRPRVGTKCVEVVIMAHGYWPDKISWHHANLAAIDRDIKALYPADEAFARCERVLEREYDAIPMIMTMRDELRAGRDPFGMMTFPSTGPRRI